MLKKAAINFAMLQMLIFISSILLGVQIPLVDSTFSVCAFIWILVVLFTFIPAAMVSLFFAYILK